MFHLPLTRLLLQLLLQMGAMGVEPLLHLLDMLHRLRVVQSILRRV